jgi:hypothetical protein
MQQLLNTFEAEGMSIGIHGFELFVAIGSDAKEREKEEVRRANDDCRKSAQSCHAEDRLEYHCTSIRRYVV